jgi:zinc transport system permease protein
VVIGVVFYNQLQAVCFDEEFARLRGVKVELFYVVLLCLTALTVVLLVTVVGIVMVIALITLPAAVAGHFTKTLGRMMIIAAVFSGIVTTLGVAISYGPNLPAGATVIVLAGLVYLLVIIPSHFFRRWRTHT